MLGLEMWGKEKRGKGKQEHQVECGFDGANHCLTRVEDSEEHPWGFTARSEAELNHRGPEAWSQHGTKQPPPAPLQLSSLSDRILSRKLPFLTPHSLPWPRLNQAWHPTPLSFLSQDISLRALTGCTATEQPEHQVPTFADLSERLVVWQLARPWSLSQGSPPWGGGVNLTCRMSPLQRLCWGISAKLYLTFNSSFGHFHVKLDFSETLISLQLFMSFDTINFLQWIGWSLADLQKSLGHAQLSAGLGAARREEMMKNCCWQVTAPFPAEHNQQDSTKSRRTFKLITLEIWGFERVKELIQLI